VLHEGKNRQIRRMVAKVGLGAIRIVRHSIGALSVRPLGLNLMLMCVMALCPHRTHPQVNSFLLHHREYGTGIKVVFRVLHSFKV
jgi:hypothetical protein